MKIVAGQYGGRRLNVPKNRDIRPTTDKVRGAIFNMLASRGAIEGVRVLDAFCGSGALGLEALSRGAAHCSFMDKSRSSLDLARDNAQALDALSRCDFEVRDWLKNVKKQQDNNTYGLIFLDPPYHKNIIPDILDKLVSENWLSGEAWIVCESEKAFVFPDMDNYIADHEKIYGDIKVTLVRYQPITPE